MRYYQVKQKSLMALMASGRHKWRIPAVRCHACNSVVRYPFGYPNIDITGKLDETPYTISKPPKGQVSWENYRALEEALKKATVADVPFFPGMGFGSFQGTVTHSEKRDFIWVWQQELLPKESTYKALVNAGLVVPTGPAAMKDTKTKQIRSDYQRIIDLKIVKCVSRETIKYTSNYKDCHECGWKIIEAPQKLFLIKEAIPKDLHIFIPEENAAIVASEAFVAVAKQFKNIAFEEVEVI